MSSNKYTESSPETAGIRSSFRASSLVQSVQEFAGFKEKMQDLMLPKVDFVEQDQFKKDPQCFVCEVEFSKTNRQHHCRMCGNSCCGKCSEKTINKNRVCDICFMKASQLAAENKRKKFLSALKDQTKKLKRNIEQAKLKKVEIEQESIKQEEQSNQEIRTIEKETEIYRLQYTQRAQDKLTMEESLTSIKELMNKLNQRKEALIIDFQEKEQEIRAYDTNLYLKEQELNDRKTQQHRLKKQKDDLENVAIQIEQNPEIVNEIVIEEPQQLQIQQQQQYNTNIDIDEMMNEISTNTKDASQTQQLVPKQQTDEVEEKEQYKCNIF